LGEDPELKNSFSKQAKKFRRRFRVTYPLFLYIVDECKKANIFDIVRHNHSYPIEIKILVALRILARGNCADDIEEMSGIPESTVYRIFINLLRSLVKYSLKDSYIYSIQSYKVDILLQ